MSLAYYIHVVGAAAYLLLALVLLRRAAGAGAARLIVAACVLMASWMLAVALRDIVIVNQTPLALASARLLLLADPIAAVLASVFWILFLARLLLYAAGTGASPGGVRLAVIAGLVLAVLAVAGLLGEAYLPEPSAAALRLVRFSGAVGLALVGLVLVENLVRDTGADRFWLVKFLGLGLGGFFAYDFYIYAEALLFRQVNRQLLDGRGVVALMIVPLLAVALRRNVVWTQSISASRRLVFHSATVVGGGLYLLLMGAAGYYIRYFGGDWGELLQVAFFFAALIMLVTVVSSGKIRAHAKVFIAKNLFAYKYDYREEWLRFIKTVALEESGANLGERVVRAIANILDCPGGGLWQWDDGAQAYALSAQWNYGRIEGHEPIEGARVAFLAQRNWIVSLAELQADPARHPGLDLPAWLNGEPAAWLLLPLHHNERLLGFLLLQRPRAARQLNWEDFDLLRTVGRQAASYLGEQAAVRALADARQVEIFNRRFAFVIHDIKTMISQLSLLLSNADRHGDNPEFQRDLILSVRDSVDSMNRLLAQINAERKKDRSATTIDLVPLARELMAKRAAIRPVPVLRAEAENLPLVADEGLLKAILGHLVQNAAEAAGPEGQVQVVLRRADGMAIIEVEDNGPGMDANFIREQLFRPGNSTKEAGYGIGAYQCRELVRELKGNLTVMSVPGQGTTMRASFPQAGEALAPAVQAVTP